MADKRLRIVLELVGRGLSTGLSGVRGAIQRVTGGLSDMASRGARFVSTLAEKFYFLANSMRIVSGIAKGLFERFIKGAGDAAKLEARLKVLTGSTEAATGVMEWIRTTALETGTSFEGLAGSMGLMVVAAKDMDGAFDPEKFKRLGNMLLRYSTFRPDVPIDALSRSLSIAAKTGDWSSLEMRLDIPLRALLGIKDAAEDVAGVPEEIGRGVTYIETGAADAAKDAIRSLDELEEANIKAGLTQELLTSGAALAGMERFGETWKDIARTIGEPLFEVLNEEMAKLADWLQENPELIERMATALGSLGATGIEALFEAIVRLIESIDFEKLAMDAEKFINSLTSGEAKDSLDDIVDSLSNIGSFLGQMETLGQKLGIFEPPEDYEPFEMPEVLPGEEGGFTIGKPKELGEPSPTLIEHLGNLAEAIRHLARPFPEGEEAPAGAWRPKEQKVQVEIILDDEMLDHRIRQTSRDEVTGGFNELSRNLEGGP